jgi:hypothetical protein
LGNDVPYGSYYCVFPKPVWESDFSSSVKQAQTACIKFSYDIGGDHRHWEICYEYNPAPGKSHEGIIVTYGANSSDRTHSMDITWFNDGSGIHFDVVGGSETTTCYYDVVRWNWPISDRDLKLEYFNGQPSNHSSKFNTWWNLCYLSETQPT